MPVLDHDYQVQQTGYWCGPTAAHIALSTRGVIVDQGTLARECGTTVNGTDTIDQVTRVLRARSGVGYISRYMPNDPPTREQVDLMWADLTRSINAGFGAVVNIVAPPGNQPPGYPAWQTIWHYIAVVGTNESDRTVYVADSANFSGIQHYWLTIDKLASLCTPKGYSFAPVDPPPRVVDEDDDDAAWLPVLTQLMGPLGG